MAKVRTPREAWIEAAMRALAAGGPEAVRVEALAKELGVSKGGFYWHFEDRRALLEETLDAWERSGTEEVIATVEGGAGDPRERLRRLFAMAPSARGLFAVELALRDASRRDRDLARRLRRVDDRRMEFLRALFRELCAGEEEVEARSL
ncbi:MAG TPA: helix-turn-helix domain-containing protein, partial [Solirubrobacterales bacterium]